MFLQLFQGYRCWVVYVCTHVFLIFPMKVRTQWKTSRFFYGKNRVLQAALGRTEAEEYREGLSKLAKVHVQCMYSTAQMQGKMRTVCVSDGEERVGFAC